MLPKDPAMLLCFVNTQLRDTCTSLEDFCLLYNVTPESVIETLRSIDYEYDSGQNQFI